MDLELHPGAAAAFDADGDRLVGLLRASPVKPGQRGSFTSRIPVGPTITDQDMVDEPLMEHVDPQGEILSRYFFDKKRRVGLEGDAYLELRRFVDKAGRTKPFSDGLSREFLEKEAFKWCRAKFRDPGKPPLSAHLLDLYRAEVKSRRVLVPIIGIEFEKPFILGDVRVSNIRNDIFDRGLAYTLGVRPAEDHDDIKNGIEHLRKKHLGWTAVEVVVRGEERFAYDRAFAIASDMAAVFRFMTPAAVRSNLPFPCFAADKSRVPTRAAYMVDDETGGLGMTSGIVHNAMHNYCMSFAELDEKMKLGFNRLAMFFDGTKLNDHQLKVRGALMAFSRGIGSFNQDDRLVYAMTAAEHLLLKDGNEPIQGNVGERMAFIIEQDVQARKKVAATFKQAYALRSKYVHHYRSIDDQAVLDEFFFNMYRLLFIAVSKMDRVPSQAAFFEMLDDAKFS